MAVDFHPRRLRGLLTAAAEWFMGIAEAAGLFRKGEETRRLIPLRVISQGKRPPSKSGPRRQ
jgi:hypothetical protein